MINDESLSGLIPKLLEEQENNQRTLEEYLVAFWFLANQYRHKADISVNQFMELLDSAFIVEIPPFKDEWKNITFALYSEKDDSFLAFEETVLEQIVDLREMNEANLLSNEMRYFGLDSPRGNRWFNFDPLTYLNCAIAGNEDIKNSDRILWKQIKEFLWCGQIYE